MFLYGGAHIAFLPGESWKGGVGMLRWSVIFLVIAMIAAVFGFGGIAADAAEIAKVLFYLFLGVFVITLIAGMVAGHKLFGSDS